MTEQKSIVVRVSMPKNLANKFVEESRIMFSDVRWINILFKDKMYQAMYNHQPQVIKDEIINARNEICEYIKMYYNEMKKR